MTYLYDALLQEFGKREIANTQIPSYITDNLKYKIRPYQEQAFARFILCDREQFDDKPNLPTHLLFNMATGSGKTLIMAGLILYLYEKGYRNFLFYVHTNNILEKTKDNFLNPHSSKYLFAEKIVIDGRNILVKQVANFDEADDENINIHFSSIQKLNSDLVQSQKENALSLEDFENKKVVLIGDEAHHYNSASKKQTELFGSWEKLTKDIHHSNFDNVLLEFTATLDYESQQLVEKYQDKVIYKYDLKEFRADKYSKEISLIRSLYDEKERIIQALILNLYRQELANSHNINLKPVILFKAKQTIKESEQNKANFHQLIEQLDEKMIEHVQKTSTVDIVQKAFVFLASVHLTSQGIVKRIKSNFKAENCISANNDKQAEANQIKLNTLEDANNPIRAVFAVQKLNEGWDVLNLFDIVRLYEGQNSGGSNKTIGKTTLSEAQLIGRGARYFPFALETGQNPYTRKYDEDLDNDLRVLEELYYHTKEDNRYISELKKALVLSGISDEDDESEMVQLELKFGFTQSDFYKKGQVTFNKKIEKSYDNIKSFNDLGVKKTNFVHILASGAGQVSRAFDKKEGDSVSAKVIARDIQLADIPSHIIRYSLSQNPFYYFNNLLHFFPNLDSLSAFIASQDYLAGLEITFKGSKPRLDNINNFDYLMALQALLQTIKNDIQANLTEYQGSPYFHKPIHQVFPQSKTLKVPKNSTRADPQENVVKEPNWYVYNANYGTSEEKAFVAMFARRFEYLDKKFNDIYLIRNEKAVKIVDDKGRTFEPDFLLFCKQKQQQQLIYQVFIEPKGGHLKLHDKWKEEFLQKIREDNLTIDIDSDKYVVTGVPFYNNSDENNFKEVLEDVLN